MLVRWVDFKCENVTTEHKKWNVFCITEAYFAFAPWIRCNCHRIVRRLYLPVSIVSTFSDLKEEIMQKKELKTAQTLKYINAFIFLFYGLTKNTHTKYNNYYIK